MDKLTKQTEAPKPPLKQPDEDLNEFLKQVLLERHFGIEEEK